MKPGEKANRRPEFSIWRIQRISKGEINWREAGFRARVAKISFGNGLGRQPERLDEFHGLDLEILAKR